MQRFSKQKHFAYVCNPSDKEPPAAMNLESDILSPSTTQTIVCITISFGRENSHRQPNPGASATTQQITASVAA